MDNAEDYMIDQLILQGAMEIDALAEDGSPLYKFTPKMKELYPELYAEHMTIVNKEIMNLWEKGYLKVDIFSANPQVALTQKAIDMENIKNLKKEELDYLIQIVELLTK